MNKTELIAAVAEKSGISKKDAEKAVSSTIETISIQLPKAKRFRLPVSVHLSSVRETQEQAAIREQVTQLKFLLQRFLHSRQARASRML